MDRSIYLTKLNELKDLMSAAGDSPFFGFAKVVTLVNMNMRWEKYAFSSATSSKHPYEEARLIVSEAINQYKILADISFIEADETQFNITKPQDKEDKHQELFNEIWNRYDEKSFQQYIDRYIYRININNLGGLIKDKLVVDLGCGNGVFCFALIESGAQKACGIDFGSNSIQYAQKVAESKNLLDQVDFRVKTVYDTGFPDNYFDFAVQNGVFHHLDDENRAIREAKRILKPGGWFWYYTAGEGGIQRVFWDVSVEILKDVPVLFIEGILTSMNVSRNKIAHLSDGLSATYSKTTWQGITTRLADNGFGNFKRVTGGFSTDFDQDRIDSDPFGREKFGEGDLRILCQLTDI